MEPLCATGRLRGAVHLLGSMPVRIAGTAAGVVLLLHGIDAGAVMRSLVGVDGGWLSLSILLTAFAYALSIVEWGVLLRAASAHTGWLRIGSWQVQSVFVGSVVPGGAGGDALRAVQASRVAGTSRGLASLFCSRMAGSCGMAGWALAGALMLRAQFGWITVVAAVVLVSLIALGWLVALTAAPLVRALQVRSSPCLVSRVAALAMPLTDALRWFRSRRDALGWAVIAGVLGWTVNLLSLAALARAVGADIGPELFAVAVPLALLTTLVPFAVSGIGLREGVLVGLLAHAGVEPHRAAALAILVDLQPLPVALCGAALWLTERRDRSLSSRPDVALQTAA
jgi:glycosyltransferase 2 family protein